MQGVDGRISKIQELLECFQIYFSEALSQNLDLN